MADDNVLGADPLYGSDGRSKFWHQPFFKESSYVASIYADSLRDNFITAGITDSKKTGGVGGAQTHLQ